MLTKELRKTVKECLDNEDDKLSDWEIEFLDSVNKWTGDYTEKQAVRIQAIWEKLYE